MSLCFCIGWLRLGITLRHKFPGCILGQTYQVLYSLSIYEHFIWSEWIDPWIWPPYNTMGMCTNIQLNIGNLEYRISMRLLVQLSEKRLAWFRHLRMIFILLGLTFKLNHICNEYLYAQYSLFYTTLKLLFFFFHIFRVLLLFSRIKTRVCF